MSRTAGNENELRYSSKEAARLQDEANTMLFQQQAIEEDQIRHLHQIIEDIEIAVNNIDTE